MNRKLKHIAAFALAAALVFGAGGAVSAAGEIAAPGQASVTAAQTDGGFTIENGVLTAYIGSDSEVTIPDGVKEIGDEAFQYAGMTSVTIPHTVTKIGQRAFMYCSSLNSVVIPSSVTSIGDSAFSFCSALKTAEIPSSVTRLNDSLFRFCNRLTSVNIPNSVTSIGEYAFGGCSALTSVTIPDSVTELSGYAFWSCTSLSDIRISRNVPEIREATFLGCRALGKVTIPGSVKTIGESAFSGCSGLTSVSIPDSVTEIGGLAFYNCKKLERVTLPSSVVSIGEGAFKNCAALGGVTIPSSVREIGSEAFYECANLTSVEIPSSVTVIEGGLFGECTLLRSVSLPATVKSIGNGAFAGCRSLASITLPGSVESLGEHAFSGCEALRTVHIPDSVRTIGEDAFSGCSSLTSFTVGSANPAFSARYGTLYNKSGTALLRYPGNKQGEVVFPASVNTIGDRAFSGCNGVEKVVIPDSVTSIGESAFMSCGSLAEITIPAGVTSIGNSAFTSCDNLKRILFYGTERQWESISQFAGAGSARVICDYDGTIPLAILSSPGSFVIQKGESITLSVEADGTGLTYQWYYKKADSDTWNVWKNRTHAEEVVTPNDSWNGIQLFCKVKDSAGSSLRSDVAMVIIVDESEDPGDADPDQCGDNLRWKLDRSTGTLTITGSGEMWDYMYESWLLAPWCLDYENFEYTAENVKKVEFSGNITSIGDSAFAMCTNLTSVTIPDTVKSIGDQAFAGTGLTKITIPASVTEFGYDVFSSGINFVDEESYVGGPSKLTSITVDGGSRTFSSVGGVMFSKDKSTLVCYPCAKKGAYTVSSTVSTIEAFAFSECVGLTGVTIPPSVRTIGVQAFSYCTGLTSVAVPEGVRVIDEGAFLDAELNEISIPKSVTSIGYYALNNTDDDGKFLPIRKIKYAGGKAAWEKIATVGEFDDDFSFRDYLKGASIEFGEESGALSILTQPADQTVTLGETLTLSVEAEGEGLTYQWYYKKAGQTAWNVWKNRTHASETVTPNATWNGIRLYCEIKDSAGHSVNSDAATITVNQPAVRITKQPESKTLSLGETLTLSVEAEGEGLTYQWYYKKAGQTAWNVWKNRTHASETVTPNATWNGIRLYCEIRDSAGHSVNSDAATVTVNEPSVRITKQPTDQTVTLGETLTLSVEAEGEGLTYQWYYKKAGQTAWNVWKNRTHAEEVVTPNATWNGIRLYCEVKDRAGHSVNSDAATVTVNEPSVRITKQPADQTVTLGESLTLSVKAEGEGLTYQWYYKKTGQTAWNVWKNRTHAEEVVTPNATWNGIQLYCEIKDSAGGVVKSDAATITLQ